MTCLCDLPDGTPHDCSKERQIDGAISFCEVENERRAPEFYPGWAEAAGKRAGDADRARASSIRHAMNWRANQIHGRVDHAAKTHRNMIDSQFKAGRVALDVALRETSK